MKFIEKIRDFFKRYSDPYYYISEQDWMWVCHTIQDMSPELDWSEYFTSLLRTSMNETSLLISECDVLLAHLDMHSVSFSKFILITYLILNYQNDSALVEFNNLLWEDKLKYCKFILGEDISIEIN